MTDKNLVSEFCQNVLDVAQASRARLPPSSAIFLDNNAIRRIRLKVDQIIENWDGIYAQADVTERARCIESLCELTAHNFYAAQQAQPIFQDLVERGHISPYDLTAIKRKPQEQTAIMRGSALILNPLGA